MIMQRGVRIVIGSALALLVSVFLIGGLSIMLYERWNSDRVIVLSNAPVEIGPEGVVISPTPSIIRSARAAEVALLPTVNWKANSSFTAFELSDGRNVSVKATATTASGNKFVSSSVGYSSPGSEVTLRFEPRIPRGEEIISVKLEATETVSCLRIYWIEWNPL